MGCMHSGWMTSRCLDGEWVALTRGKALASRGMTWDYKLESLPQVVTYDGK
jgi:hypothetical protein